MNTVFKTTSNRQSWSRVRSCPCQNRLNLLQPSQEVHNLQPLDTDDNMLIAKCSKPSTKIQKRIKCDLSNMTTSNSSSLVYKCKKCWRKYPLKSHVALHRLATHKNKEHKTPLLCSNCGSAFTDNGGQGPWKDCCISNLRKYYITRSLT